MADPNIHSAKLLWRSVVWHWRQDVAASSCIAIAVAVLVGAIVVGSSLQQSLVARMTLPLGEVRYAVNLPYPVVGERLHPSLAGVLELPAVAGTDSSQQRAVRLWQTGKTLPPSWRLPELAPEEVAVNGALARDLAVRAGDWIVLRVDVSPLRPEAALFATRAASETSQTLRVRIASVVEEPWADFSMQQNQATARNVFMRGGSLKLAAGMVNRVLSRSLPGDEFAEMLNPADLGLDVDAQGTLVHSRSVVFTDGQQRALRQLADPRLISTYICDEIRHGDSHVSYGIVAADERVDLAVDQVVLNDWVATDLGVKAGDVVRLSPLIARPDGSYVSEPVALNVKAVERTGSGLFRPEVAPDVRGITSAKRMDEWKTPFQVDMARVTSRDEAYWETHRASPKAVVSFRLLQEWWRKSGHSSESAVTTVALSQPIDPKSLARAILANEPGTAPVDLQAQARAASKGSADFASLFGAMSAFLIIAAVIVSAGVIRLTVETRLQEIGLAGALGLSRASWVAMIVVELAIGALIGTAGGIVVGLAYAAGLLQLFVSLARDTWDIPPVSLFFSWTTVAIAAAGVAAVTLFAGWTQTRREFRRPTRELLWEITDAPSGTPGGAKTGFSVAVAMVCLAIAVAGLVLGLSGTVQRVVAFVVVAAAALGVGVFGVRGATKMPSRRAPGLGLMGMAVRLMHADRRRAQLSFVTFAVAFFVVSSVSLFRAGESSTNVFDRGGPTGGFAIRVESPVAYRQDLSTARARGEMGIERLPAGVNVFSLRVSDATEGGCLNLASPGEMQVIGVSPQFVARGGFDLHVTDEVPNPWTLLERADADAVPVFGDEETMVWIARRRLGEVFESPVGGVQRRLRLSGTVRGGLFSGQLLMSEANFRRLLPNTGGFAMHLVECPPDQLDNVLKVLSPLSEYGMTVGMTQTVIREVASVQRLYMTMFLLLGGLGLMLGSIGGAAMLTRDVLSRQGELALLSAVGWTRRSVAAVVLLQHLTPVGFGIALGLLAATVGYLSMGIRPEPWWAVFIAVASLAAGFLSYLVVVLLAAPRTLGTTLRAANT